MASNGNVLQHSILDQTVSVLTGLFVLGLIFGLPVLLLVPKQTIRAFLRKLKPKKGSYDDGKSFTPLSKQQKEKLLRRQRIEEKRQQETAKQQKQRQLEDFDRYKRALQKEAREQEEAERVFKAFIRIIEEEYYKEQLRKRAKWDEQEARRQWQQQQSKTKQQQQSSSNQHNRQPTGQRSRFEGMMGFGAQVLPQGCVDGPVQEVLLAADYYQVLGVTRNDITIDALKAARKAKVLAVHPDKVGHDTPGANIAGGRVNVAYETLSSSQLRKEYDTWLAGQQRGARQQHGGASTGASR